MHFAPRSVSIPSDPLLSLSLHLSPFFSSRGKTCRTRLRLDDDEDDVYTRIYDTLGNHGQRDRILSS